MKNMTMEELKALYVDLEVELERREKEEKEKLKAEKKARKKEVDDAVAKAIELVKAWTDDFGTYSYKSDDDNSIFSSKFWNWIW